MAFLDNLVSTINQQVGVEDNQPKTFDYNLLGTFANQVDKSAQRVYLEDGLINKEIPRIAEVLWQQPDFTLVVKKRQFASLAENFRLDLLNNEEKLYLKTVKRLFQRKCKIISEYEKLSKFDYLASKGVINNYALPAIFAGIDFLNSANPGLIDGKTQSALDKIRQVFALSQPSLLTTWITNTSIPSEFGDGTGVFELTLVQNASWTNSIKFGGGSAEISIQDPYRLMVITEQDIEQAIADASNLFNTSFFSQTESELQSSIDQLSQQLSQSRIERNVSQIKLIVNNSSFLQKKVRLIMEEEGIEIPFSFNGGFVGFGSSINFDISLTQGRNALTNDEIDLLTQLIQDTYILLGFQETKKSKIKDFNGQNAYLRQRLIQEFEARSIIDAMDIVHIYVSSKTQLDNKVQGFKSNSSFLGTINSVAESTQSSLNDFVGAFSGSNNSTIEQEKNAIVGEDFPTWLWLLVRNDFTKSHAGQHRFAGVVERAPSDYSNGIHTINVSCRDNTYYFNLGQMNIKPALDVFDSGIFDPLTPFKIDFDESNGFVKGEIPPLLDENIRLLSGGIVRANSGRNIGKIIDSSNYSNLEIEKTASNIFRKKFIDPNGFVYRWKRGIQTETFSGQPFSNLFRKNAVPALTNDPFAGQDVMNVLSLIICGQPYNFNTFLKAAINSGNLSKDNVFNNTITNSYFRSLIDDFSRNNTLWGNFVPFKKMIINESGYNFLRSGEYDLSVASKQLSDLLSQRAKRFDELTSILPQFANNPQFYKINPTNTGNLTGLDLNAISTLGQDIIDLDIQIAKQQKIFSENLKNANLRSQDGTLKIFGDDIFFDPSLTQNSATTNEQKISERESFRKKIHNLTQRRIWKVKANEDPNLLIIDDSYDKNYDIQTFEKSLSSSLSTFRSTYTKPGEKIEGISQMLGLEVFANTQGHIEIRPPQYNKIPTTALSRIINKKQTHNIQLFPKYLEKLFFNQILGLTDRVEVLEDEIRLRAAALGYVTDEDIKKLLSGAISVQGNTNFTFITSEDGNLGSKDLRNLLTQADPDFMENANLQALNNLSSAIKYPVSAAINFDITKQIRIVNEQPFRTNDDKINDRINEIRNRLQLKTGTTPLTKQQLLPNDKSLSSSGRSQTDVLNLTNQISQFLSERQNLIKILANAVKNLDQGVQLNKDPELGKDILYPTLYQKNKNFPSILEHMIEDETYDDLGENSGQRFVLRDFQIKNLRVESSPPPFTIVEVNGELESGLVSLPSGLEIGQGGNGISTAIAVDNDMWRMYGFRGYNAVSVPFLSDPDSQCAPYAVWLLNQARKNIFHASVTLTGNEYYQPGEVYYIESLNKLFYAESISENFSYNQEYSCSMNLTYGHSPGEFIPTMLDIIGKGLYSNRFSSNLIRHVRNSAIAGEQHISILVNDSPTVNSDTGEFVNFTSDTALQALISGNYGDANKKALSDLIVTANGTLGISNAIEIRIYSEGEPDIGLKNLAQGVVNYLLNPSKASQTLDGKDILPDIDTFGLNPDFVNVSFIDLSNKNEQRSPSSSAWSISRTISKSEDISEEKNILFSKILDLWIVQQPTSKQTTSTAQATSESQSEADVALKNKYYSQFAKSLK